MKKGGGKEKGSSFERFISREFDTWWRVPPGTFWRTTNSGGWIEPGDIAPRLRKGQEEIWWPFVVECKFYKSFDILSTLNRGSSIFWTWWKQVLREQIDSSKVGFLIFKKNYGPIYCAIDNDKLLLNENKIILDSSEFYNVSIYLFSDLKKKYSIQDLKQLMVKG